MKGMIDGSLVHEMHLVLCVCRDFHTHSKASPLVAFGLRRTVQVVVDNFIRFRNVLIDFVLPCAKINTSSALSQHGHCYLVRYHCSGSQATSAGTHRDRRR